MTETATTQGQFRKYDHLERLGHQEVREITVGKIYVFPKIDGTNASVWWDGERVRCGSRNRVLSLDKDNQGFCSWVNSDDPKAVQLREVVELWPHLTFYGEWLVPHSLKTYRDEAWRRFWIFDVFHHEKGRYLSYETIVEVLGIYSILDVIHPLCTIENPSDDQLKTQVEQNTFLIEDGAGVGEGVVIKNYEWENRFGRQPWAKIVRNSFKELNYKTMGAPHKQGERIVEQEIVDAYVDAHLVGKTRAKVVVDLANDLGIDLSHDPNAQQEIAVTHRGRVIPQLLGRVFHDLVTEEIWTIVKKFKNPKIDFKKLQQFTTIKTKQLSEDLF